ncbi:beta-lactamase family protein [Kovacikia minuta CCNUW1]|uniref:serine hydrolase n=1 Tax=Kovacikia minuta TaxID=2931930 RepID=UPI001CC9DECF|nr:serine hydrolase domain-containing protein [Kovacikia minuta]UBF24335.1 beta-lactamase family protein [Kovacikia minuta CCNUW1]
MRYAGANSILRGNARSFIARLIGTLIVLVFQLRVNAAQPSLETKIDRFITHQMSTQHIPGLALAITHENQVMYVKGYGQANTQQPVTLQTQFPIASLSKSFTAVAVLQLLTWQYLI